MQTHPQAARRRRSARNHASGVKAEALARSAIEGDGWTVRGARVRTKAGEIDLLAEKGGLLAVIEVKSRPTLRDAALSLSLRQRRRLIAAAEIVVAEHPDWSHAGVRFDLVVVDTSGAVRRIADAFREGD
jgi:putative endonuclease